MPPQWRLSRVSPVASPRSERRNSNRSTTYDYCPQKSLRRHNTTASWLRLFRRRLQFSDGFHRGGDRRHQAFALVDRQHLFS
jgi:hypothetical protein